MGTRRFLLLSLLTICSLLYAVDDPDPGRYFDEINAFRQWDRKNAIPQNHILFIGSSSIRMWMTADWFPGLPVVNRGFGGAHISDLLHYKKDILIKYGRPDAIVFYCGGNDVASGKTPERVIDDFNEFWSGVQNQFPGTPLIYIPVKPCPSRWNIWAEEKQVNKEIRRLCRNDSLLYYADTAEPMLATGTPPADSLFIKDGLHLNENGYRMWTAVVDSVLRAVNNGSSSKRK